MENAPEEKKLNRIISFFKNNQVHEAQSCFQFSRIAMRPEGPEDTLNGK